MTTCARTTFFLMLGGCAASGGKGTDTGVLMFTDANVAPITGGYTGEALPVASGADLCFDVSALGETVSHITIMRLALADGVTRCALGNDAMNQSDVTGMMSDDASVDGVSCLTSFSMPFDDFLIVCDPKLSWAVGVWDGERTNLALRMLDPCAEDGPIDVVVEETAWTEAELAVDLDAAEPLLVKPGVRYTLDWSALTVSGFGDAVDPTDPEGFFEVLIANVDTEVSLDDAALAPGARADVLYTLSAAYGVSSADLEEATNGEPDGSAPFPGFSSSGNWLLGLSQQRTCLPSDILARVEVED